MRSRWTTGLYSCTTYITDGVTEKAKQGQLLDSGLSTKVDEIRKSVHCYAEV